MRLIGKSRLFELAQNADADLRGAVMALHAELVAAEWKSASDASSAFPTAAHKRQRLVITLDDRHCVVVAINYETGIAMIEFAGREVGWTDTPMRRTEKHV